MVDHPLVSVIIPAYNAESYIDEALQSALDQTYSNLEIIVVNDGSKDGTAERVAAYRPRVHYYQQTNSGGYPGAPRNTGIKHCHGRYLCFLDADDIMLPDRVEKQVDFLSKHPEVGLVYVDYQNFSSKGLADKTHFQTCSLLHKKLECKQSLVLPREEAAAHLAQENFGLPSSMMIKREVLNSVPDFSTALQTGEDFHYCYLVARHYSLGVIKHLGALRRLHGSNATGDTLRVLHNSIICRTELRDTESNATNIRLLDEFLYRCEIDLARTYANQRNLRKATVHNLRALTGFVPTSSDHLKLGLRTLIRTAAIALHLKAPCP